MIEVYKNFYDEGFTIDGKENRIMLKKNDETFISMDFSGKKVKLIGYKDNQEVHSITLNFNEIYGISTDCGNPPTPAVLFY